MTIQNGLWHELKHHLPYSVFATAGGILLAGLLLYVAVVASSLNGADAMILPTGLHDEHGDDHAGEGASQRDHNHSHEIQINETGAQLMASASQSIFHVFHPVHLLLSAIATTAMFWRYERKLVKAVLTGVVGSIGVCGISDVFIPYLGAMLLGAHMDFHWCLLQHPMLVLPFCAVGVVMGLLAAETIEAITYFSHSAHVFVSSAASLFYLVTFGMLDWPHRLGSVFILLILAVTLPCCFSDIVFPLLVMRRGARLQSCCGGHHHHGHAQVTENAE